MKYNRDNLRKLSQAELAQLAFDEYNTTLTVTTKDRMVREVLSLQTKALEALDRAEAEADAITDAEIIEIVEPNEPLGNIPAPVEVTANESIPIGLAKVETFCSIHHSKYTLLVSPRFYALFGVPYDKWGSQMVPLHPECLGLGPEHGIAACALNDREYETAGLSTVRRTVTGAIIRRGRVKGTKLNRPTKTRTPRTPRNVDTMVEEI